MRYLRYSDEYLLPPTENRSADGAIMEYLNKAEIELKNLHICGIDGISSVKTFKKPRFNVTIEPSTFLSEQQKE